MARSALLSDHCPRPGLARTASLFAVEHSAPCPSDGREMATRWGTLHLVENPQEPKTPGFEGPVEKKVPRTIFLRGKVRLHDELRPRVSAV